MLARLFGRTEHSDRIPVDVVVPVQELRSFLRGEISRGQYDAAVKRGEDALVDGWDNESSTDDQSADLATSA